MDSNRNAPTTTDRDRRKATAEKTEEAVREGIYETEAGEVVYIHPEVAFSQKQTVTFGPDILTNIGRSVGSRSPTKVWAERVDTLVAAERMTRDGGLPLVLNFASAKNPGGGWLRGATGQEESLSRRSALASTLAGNPEYRDLGESSLYRSWAIYSPMVPVIRDVEEKLIPHPWRCSFITCPAPNLEGKLSQKLLDEVPRILRQRIDMILRVAVAKGHRRLVLGAWGCGVFKNNPTKVAKLFGTVLKEYEGCFNEVVFAIVGSDETFQPFAEVFGT